MTLPTDSNPASISDHLFTPRGDWWQRCVICGLGAAAHVATDFVLETTPAPPYRCPNCVQTNTDPCPHARAADA